MGHVMFYLAVVAACLLWSAAFIAAAARTQRVWLRRLLVAAGCLVPPLAILPWVGLTGWFALLKFQANWFGPTLTAFISALVGGLWIRAAGMSRDASGARRVAADWPVVALAAGFVLAKAVAFGTLLFIDNAVVAEGRMLRVEAAQMMAAALPPAPVADDDAAPLYLRAIAAIESDTTLGQAGSPAAEPLTADVGSPAVAAILARHAATLDLVRRAADRPGCRFTRDWSRPSVDMILPEVHGLRQAGRLLALAARREAATGGAAAALADVVRIRRVGMHAAMEPIIVCGLVGQASDTLAVQLLADTLPRLGKQDLPLLDTAAFRDVVEAPVSYQQAFLGEEAFGLAALADLAVDRRGSVLSLLLHGSPIWVTPHEFPLDGSLSFLYRCFLLPADESGYRGIMRKYQSLFTSQPSGRSFPEIKRQTDEIEQGIKERRGGIFTSLMTPALGAVLASQAKSEALHAAAGVLVAVTRERLASGEVPSDLADLVPAWLPAVPRDPFTADTPLVVKPADDGWLVYSVGPDGEDDGGPVPPGPEPAEGNDDVGLRLAR